MAEILVSFMLHSSDIAGMQYNDSQSLTISGADLATFFTDPTEYSYPQMIHVVDTRPSLDFDASHIIGATNVTRLDDLPSLYSKYVAGAAVVFYGDSTKLAENLTRTFREFVTFRRFDDSESESPGIFLLEGTYNDFYMQYPTACIGEKMCFSHRKARRRNTI